MISPERRVDMPDYEVNSYYGDSGYDHD